MTSNQILRYDRSIDRRYLLKARNFNKSKTFVDRECLFRVSLATQMNDDFELIQTLSFFCHRRVIEDLKYE